MLYVSVTFMGIPGAEGRVGAVGGLSGVSMWVPPRIVSGLRCRPPGWRGLCRLEGVVSPADPGTPQSGTWLAARVEFVQITLSKLAACQDGIPSPRSQLPRPAQLQTPDRGKQADVGAL